MDVHFVHAIFKISDPLCECNKDLIWEIYPYTEQPQNDRGQTLGIISRYGLKISCSQCRKEVIIPHEKFVAMVMVETNYPTQEERRRIEEGRRKNHIPIGTAFTERDEFYLKALERLPIEGPSGEK